MTGYSIVKVIDTEGQRFTYISARVLGVRGGYIFIEEQTAQQQQGDADVQTLMNLMKLPLTSIRSITVDTSVDDDNVMNAEIMDRYGN